MLHVLTRPVPEHLLRCALAISFLYPPLSALAEPNAWIGYFPAFLVALSPLPAEVLLHAFGAFEVALALWLLLARSARIPALIAGAILLTITLANPAQFLVLFRDLALALAALALAFLPHRTTT